MASTQASKAIPLTQLTILGTSITASYAVVGQFTSPVVMAFVISTMDHEIQISFDGVHDHLVVPAGSTSTSIIPLSFKSNLIVLPNPVIAVKRIGTPTTGSLYVCAFSAQVP